MHLSENKLSFKKGNSNITSGDNISVWLASSPEPIAFEPQSCDVDTDILVVGGGIAGLTTAYCLAKEGFKVILAEDGYIGSGESGRTTAHISYALDDFYCELEKKFNPQIARLAAESHSAAIEWIANTVEAHQIDCHFKRVDGYLFTHPSDTFKSLQEEYEATQRVGLPTEMLNDTPAIASDQQVDQQGNRETRCLKYPNQAQFHILLYLRGLADAFIQFGGQIYTQTKVENISKTGAMGNDFEIRANHIVVATNTPVNDWMSMHTSQWPYRTYVIAAKIPKGIIPYALFWDTGDQDSMWVSKPYHYVRLEEFDDQYDLLISGGEDHRTGQAEDENIAEEDRYTLLEAWTRKYFPAIETIEYRWSGQVIEPIDSLAFIGKNPGDDNIYIITGDSGNGMTHGTLGGMIIKDIITKKENPWIDIYRPSRITLRSTGDYLKELGNMVAQYADWFTPGDIKQADELAPGEGAILSSGMNKTALYRDENQLLHTYTAVCPHLGAILQWNADEKTFDCPAHGSRFTCRGKVINGPASTDLKKQVDTVKKEKVFEPKV